jgi:hypothetical protein
MNGLENKKLIFSSKMNDVNFIDENLKTKNFLNTAKPLNPADCRPDAAQRTSTDSLYFSNDGNSRANNKKYMTFNETDSPAKSIKQLHPIINTPQSTPSLKKNIIETQKEFLDFKTHIDEQDPHLATIRDLKRQLQEKDETITKILRKPHDGSTEEENLFNKKCDPELARVSLGSDGLGRGSHGWEFTSNSTVSFLFFLII